MKHRMMAFTLALALLISGGRLFKNLAVQTQAAAINTDAIQLSKTISETPNENGEYTISLEAYTTGAVTMGEAGNPLDIVLVLDQSSSMLCDFNGQPTENQAEMVQTALKNAATHFVDSVHENAKDAGLDHRIAIVTFDQTGDTAADFTNVQKNKGYQNIKGTIEGLAYDLEGATFTHMAMAHVASLLQREEANGVTGRDRLVVVFSDGQPNDKLYADTAIAIAKTLKDKKIEIYTIGTFGGADPSVITGAATASVGEKWMVTSKSEDPTVANRFMNYLSSNSNNAEKLGVLFTDKKDGIQCKINAEYQWKNKGYYLTARNAAELDEMFDTISQNVTVDVPSLNATGQLQDFLSPYFDFTPDFTSSEITLQTVACMGGDGNGGYRWDPTPVAADSGVTAVYHPETKSITVTGFDYAENVVTATSQSQTEDDFGRKLIVSFAVKAKAGFLGGNDVVSNTDKSGIYTEQEEPLKYFDVPDTDVVLASVPITAVDHSIYLGNVVNSGDTVLLTQSPFDGINNAYVNTTLAIYWDENANGALDDTERANFEIIEIPAGASTNTLMFDQNLAPTENAQYLVEETIIPIYGGTQQPWAGLMGDFSIYVLVPSVATQDVWVDYGVAVPLSQHCIKEVNWHYTAAVPGDAPTPTTHAPEVKLSTSPAVVDDIYTARAEQSFTVEALAWRSTDGKDLQIEYPLTEGAQSTFAVHLNLCNLTLTKTVDAGKLAFYPQTFLFTVGQGEQSFCISMTPQELANGTCAKSVMGLYAGQSIAIAEDGAWAWRYAADALPTTVVYQNLDASGAPLISTVPMPVGEKALTVQNTLQDSQWLSTDSTVVNRFDGEGDCA